MDASLGHNLRRKCLSAFLYNCGKLRNDARFELRKTSLERIRIGIRNQLARFGGFLCQLVCALLQFSEKMLCPFHKRRIGRCLLGLLLLFFPKFQKAHSFSPLTARLLPFRELSVSRMCMPSVRTALVYSNPQYAHAVSPSCLARPAPHCGHVATLLAACCSTS